MNISSIKKLCDLYTADQLRTAESELLNEQPLSIEIEGEDEGEKLTHILAAVFCIEAMAKDQININQAIRLYSQRVRSSII